MADASSEMGLDDAIEQAQPAFALQKCERSTTTRPRLSSTTTLGDDALEMANLYGVVGKGQIERETQRKRLRGQSE
ncbi:hypothetical protein DFH07DRAFT_1059293 [Mycena maculata]|uniref:Uncharacterized protein n=1 Tax=Mycena maculata TaxID=230809 RepID=A0AAD7JFE3_9AGAR|nr:hypothetical protein DFH07DRAFT_1059293 [Mycena maculata]